VRRSIGPAAVLTFLTGLVSGHETPRQVREVLEAAGNCTRMVLDLSRLQFVPVSFLKMLVLLRHRLSGAPVEMKLCGLHAQNSVALHRTRLDTLFEICADPQSAIGP
jgi:anti-anti-sigma regulatory factor